jgi:hypothetical protein
MAVPDPVGAGAAPGAGGARNVVPEGVPGGPRVRPQAGQNGPPVVWAPQVGHFAGADDGVGPKLLICGAPGRGMATVIGTAGAGAGRGGAAGGGGVGAAAGGSASGACASSGAEPRGFPQETQVLALGSL